MLKLLSNIKNIKLKKESYKIFCFFFLVYTFFGFLFSYRMAIKENIYFGADNARAFLDMTSVTYSHYRIKVHPLFLFFSQPFVFLLKAIFYDAKIAVIVLESLIGAYMTGIMDSILNILNIKKSIVMIIVLIYGFSFSLILFSSVPETFIYSGFWLIMFWFFMLNFYKDNNIDEKKKILLFIIFGVTSFGLTITNYLTYFIGVVVYVLYKEKDIRKVFAKVMKINFVNMFVIGFLCILQKLVWNTCPIFVTSIINGITGKGYEETLYMNFSISLQKIAHWSKGIFFYSIIFPAVKWVNGKYSHLGFSNYNIFIILLLGVFYIVFLLSFIMKNKTSSTRNEEKYYFISLIVAFCSHIGLHFFYGYAEAFMYTPHYFYIFFIIFAYLLNSVKKENIRKSFMCFLILFLIVEVINNLYYAFISAKISLEAYNMTIPVLRAIVGSLVCFILLYLVLCFIECIERKHKIEILTIGATSFFDIFIRNIKIVGVVVLIICMFICYNCFNISLIKSVFTKILAVFNV